MKKEILEKSLLNAREDSVRACLLQGPPGSGKTFFAEQFAKKNSFPLVVYQCHDWTTSEEIFAGINVSAVVRGDSEHVVEVGALLHAAKLSSSSPVVLLIDELDKAPLRVENLFLDALQSGRVPVSPTETVNYEKGNLFVIITSNSQREHSDALLRRVRRVQFEAMTLAKIVKILESQGVPKVLARPVVKVAAHLCSLDEQTLSVQEAANCCHDLLTVAESSSDVKEIIGMWGCRGPSGFENLTTIKGHEAVWSEVVKLRG